jgi:DNA mismatch repair protein MutL
MPIRILSDSVASQIAAGEVVERPASVVKELLENALDAGARSITITIEGGGRALIRVADDGCGIPAEEVELAFARHATSKLASADDLFHVQTLGFRGEALASIASVSRVAVLTRAARDEVGAQLRLEGGNLMHRSGLGAPQGTVISVENLFYNVPARLKFLKSETAERSHIALLVSRYALAYPAIRFKLIFDNRTQFQSSGNGEAREVLAQAYGVEVAKQLIEVSNYYDVPSATEAPAESADDDPFALHDRREHTTLMVRGYVSPPAINRSNRRDVTFFVNGRWIQDQRLSTAVLHAYHTLLMVGRFPLAVLFITLPPEDVDVNVHPTKAEVRFRNADAAFTAVERTIRKALTERAPVPAFTPKQWYTGGEQRNWAPDWGIFGQKAEGSGQMAESGGQSAPIVDDAPISNQQSTISNAPPLPLAPSVPLLRVIGQIGAAYIVAEGPDGLYLIDQHAAHERILYEAFSLQRAAAQIVSQVLLEPVAVEVPADAATLLDSQIHTLAQIGLVIEPFGRNVFLVRSLPTILGKVDPARAVRVVVEDFEEDETVLATEVEARLIARVCKRAAVKAGQVLSPAEMNELARQLEACAAPRTCPHGRPTMIHLSVDMLEKQFGRRG